MAILVTGGGTKGIGRAIALRFAAPGTDVLLNYRSDETGAVEAAAAVATQGALTIPPAPPAQAARAPD